MKRSVFKGSLLFIASVLASSPAFAQQSQVRALQGQLQVSGDGQCAFIDKTQYILSFNSDLPRKPSIALQTLVSDPNDQLQARVLHVYTDHFVVEATAVGRTSHQLCATAIIKWTATY